MPSCFWLGSHTGWEEKGNGSPVALGLVVHPECKDGSRGKATSVPCCARARPSPTPAPPGDRAAVHLAPLSLGHRLQAWEWVCVCVCTERTSVPQSSLVWKTSLRSLCKDVSFESHLARTCAGSASLARTHIATLQPQLVRS